MTDTEDLKAFIDSNVNGTCDEAVLDNNKKHYVDKSTRDRCQNTGCSTTFRTFPNFRWPHHCRRCGEIFCKSCLQQRRRLNVLGQLDPLGSPCKVCFKCLQDVPIVLECTIRNHKEEFIKIRAESKDQRRQLVCEATLDSRKRSILPVVWREQFEVDVFQECNRLLKGFHQSLSVSKTIKTFKNIKARILDQVFDWEKSIFWKLEDATASCRQCNGKLDKRKKRNCRVCGLALCKQCSYKELLIYYEDSTPTDSERERQPRITIIRVDGSPTVEPKCSVLLYICQSCKEGLVVKQTANRDWFLNKPIPPDCLNQIAAFDEKFRCLTTEFDNVMDTIKTDEDHTDDSLNRMNNQLATCAKKKLDEYYALCAKVSGLLRQNKGTLSSHKTLLITNYLQTKCVKYMTMKRTICRRNPQLISKTKTDEV